MGTGFKGYAKYFRSIGQNVLPASLKFEYRNGRFGVCSPSTGNKTRNILSSNPLKTATEFYNIIAYGGIENTYYNGKMRITHMADGSIITWRSVSSSDGSPVVEINIKKSSHSGGLKEQKIHFEKE